MASRTQTAAVESEADPAVVLAVLGDPQRLADWAPAFVDRVEGEPGAWVAVKGDSSFALAVETSPAGTVDYLREVTPGRRGGAYLRVVPRPGGGSTIVMTVPVPPGGAAAEVTATLADELSALIGLV
jgi:hypothetical protein